jgi:hypothetical protein
LSKTISFGENCTIEWVGGGELHVGDLQDHCVNCALPAQPATGESALALRVFAVQFARRAQRARRAPRHAHVRVRQKRGEELRQILIRQGGFNRRGQAFAGEVDRGVDDLRLAEMPVVSCKLNFRFSVRPTSASVPALCPLITRSRPLPVDLHVEAARVAEIPSGRRGEIGRAGNLRRCAAGESGEHAEIDAPPFGLQIERLRPVSTVPLAVTRPARKRASRFSSVTVVPLKVARATISSRVRR